MIVVSYGGGTNSAGVLVGLHERCIRPDAIVFADTGGEKPHTYKHVQIVSDWCESVGFPRIQTVRASETKTLESDCLERNALPSVAYGMKTCSLRWKAQPFEKWANNNEQAKAVWDAGGKVTKIIGFDAGEPQRAKDFQSDKFNNWYPLIEWGWAREECINAIRRAGIPQPGKSACFFCPNSKPSEIQQLKVRYPDLYRRALDMEAGADLTHIRGLGRTFAWATLDGNRDWVGFREMPCECYDGD